jgi:NodT family efflux transporter outer membrane factor (OMF) lipoprotein
VRSKLGAGALGALLLGCNVGPRYVRPSAATPAAFKEDSPAAYRDVPPGTWHPARPRDAASKGRWWEIFHEPELDALEAQLDISNQTIAQYFHNFMAARAQVDEARAGYFPVVGLSPSYTRTFSGSGSGSFTATTAAANAGAPTASGIASQAGGGLSSFNFFAVPAFQASWAPDLWQRVSNAVRQARAAAQVSAADLENERLTEQAALAQFYFQLRGQDALADVYERTIAEDQKSLDFTRAQFETGIGTYESVAQAQVTLENAEATAVGIATDRGIYEHAIATLIGRPASELSLPTKALSTPVPAIPVGVPSDVLQRRPDVAAAERTVAQANALIGVQMAAFYPTVNLTASGGFASTSLSSLFSLPSFFWSLGASAAETIFDGGLRRATVAQYKQLYEADVAAYRQTVLTAFQQVEDELVTLRVTSQQIASQERAVGSAKKYLDIAQASYSLGVTPYLDVITAQSLLLGDEQTLVTLRVSEMVAAVQLVQALGGGWD